VAVVLGGMGKKGPNEKRVQQLGASCRLITLRHSKIVFFVDLSLRCFCALFQNHKLDIEN
jgi:hypothetical protein